MLFNLSDNKRQREKKKKKTKKEKMRKKKKKKKKKKNVWPFNFLSLSHHLIDLSAETAPVPRSYRAMAP